MILKKIELYNRITNKTRIVDYNYYQNTDFETCSHLHFSNSSTYEENRAALVKDMFSKYEARTNMAEHLSDLNEIKEVYFDSTRTFENEGFEDSLLADNTTNSFPEDLIDCLSQIINRMSETDFGSFVNLAFNFEPLTLIVAEPVFIAAIGYSLFSSCVKFLHETGNFLALIKKSLFSLNTTRARNFSYGVFKHMTKSYVNIDFLRGTLFSCAAVGATDTHADK